MERGAPQARAVYMAMGLVREVQKEGCKIQLPVSLRKVSCIRISNQRERRVG